MKVQHCKKSDLKVILLENIHSSAAEAFEQHGFGEVQVIQEALQGDDLVSVAKDCHILGVRSRTQITKEFLNHAHNLMGVGCFCIGTSNVDLKGCLLQGIPVFNAPHSNTRSVAELVLGLTVMLLRDIFPKCMAAHRGVWVKSATGNYEVRGKSIGIVGYGHIGSQVSILAESLGMQVYYYDIESKLPLGNAQPVDSLEELISLADVVTVHVPETPLTRNMFNEKTFGVMKKGACFINASRGVVVDIDALKRVLEEKRIKGAALDVFSVEPASNDSPFECPLLGVDNVILTPHIGGATEEAQLSIGREVAKKMMDYIEFGSTMGSVNFPQLSLTPHSGTTRIIHTHNNIPGMLKQVNERIADEEINVTSQYLLTNEDIGYVVLDIEDGVSDGLLPSLSSIEGTLCLRVISE